MISELKSALQLIGHNLEHLVRETRLTKEQTAVLNDCTDKIRGVDTIDVPLFEPSTPHDFSEMQDLLSTISAQIK